jgi:protein SCO1/2
LAAVAASLSSCRDVKAAAILSRVHGVAITPAQSKQDFTLDDTEGRPFHFLADTRGTVTLVYFGYTNCPDVCPAQLANIAAGMRSMSPTDQAKVRVLFVTTDPARDTPDRLRAWLNNFDRRFIGLRGSVDTVTAIEARFGLPPATVEMLDSGAAGPRAAYGMGHAAQVFAFTPDDSLRVEYPSGFGVADWENDLPKLARIR